MSISDSLKRFIEKQDKKQALRDAANKDLWHSRSYHKYFEGYTEYYERDSSGKDHLKRLYTGKYYMQCLSVPRRLLLRLLYTILFIISVVLFSYTAVENTDFNYLWYVSASYALCIPFYFWTFMRLTAYIFAPKKMKIYTYKSTSLAIKKSTLYLISFLCLSCVINIVYQLLNLQFSAVNIFALIRLAIACVCITAIRIIEARVEYRMEINKTVAPVNGTVIE